MNVRDSTGRSVSLLNEEPISLKINPVTPYLSPCHASSFDLIQSHAIRSHTSSPATPALTRADSCDTLPSPTTPSSPYPTSFQNAAYSLVTLNKEDSLVDYRHLTNTSMANRSHITAPSTTSTILASAAAKKLTLTTSKFSPSNPGSARSHRPTGSYELRKAYMEPQVYDDDCYFGSAIPTERVPKRYPCRYRDSHHCLKTFTTSGHASRHSKIHTAEKGVSCTWYGCHKKFTRSDNMKQHLETHTKERSRASKSSLNSTTSPTTLLDSSKTVLTIPAGVKKLSNHRCNHRHGSQAHILSSSSSSSSTSSSPSPHFPSTPTSLSSSPSFPSPSFSSPSSISYHSTKMPHRPHSIRSPSDMSSLLDPNLVKQLHIMVSGHSDGKFHSNHGLEALATAAGTRNLHLK